MTRPPRTRYAKSGDLNIAYQVFGEGDIDVVFVPGFISHLDLAWENPVRSAGMVQLASFARVITFDKRGTGLSDRDVNAVTGVEERMDDIRAVMDAAGCERAALIGYSEGGPMAIMFAATYPERVTALVLGGTFARLDAPVDLDEQLAALEESWGSGLALSTVFIPGVDREFAARYERSAATPRAAAEILRANVMIDVTAALSAISVPTLVLHRARDPLVPVEMGRALAAGIRGARLVERDLEHHLPSTIREWEEEIGEVEEFLTGARHAPEPDRVLATVMFTDIVDSTQRAAAEGDSAWRDRLEHHHRRVRRLVEQHRGRQIKTTGDGVLATFDGPARGVRCAKAIVDSSREDGLTIRAGLHTGEVELVDDDVAGIAVHLASRVESAAAPGRVYVSPTVHDLVIGSGIAFADKGHHQLKGIPGEWRLYEVTSA